MKRELHFKAWLEAIGTEAWDEEKQAMHNGPVRQQERQIILQILSQAIGELSQGSVYGVADQVSNASQRLQAVLKDAEKQRMSGGLSPVHVLETVADQLAAIEPKFNNLSSKEQIKKATATQLFAVQSVVRWLNKLPLWQVPLANQGQLP